MKKLTKREKLLIYLLACFLIGFFGIYFVVLPSVQGFQVVNDQAAEAQFTRESMEMAIEAIPTTMQEKAQAQANLTSSKAVYPQQLANEGLDMLLTQLCLDYSLAPKVLSVASNGVGEVLTFVPYTSEDAASAVVGSTGTTSTTTATSSSEDSTTSTTTADSSETTTTETTESSETTEATETTDTGDGTETGAAVQTLIGVVNMEVTGTQANFYRLLDAVAARPDMIITAFEIRPETTTTGSTSSTSTTSAAAAGIAKLDSGKVAINVTFEVYMMAK